MEFLIQTLGAKLCCVLSAGCGGAANALTKRTFNWAGVKDVFLALVVGWIAAEFFIPPIMKHWTLDMTWGPAIAFVIGFCGIRLLPVIEETLLSRIKSVAKKDG